MMLGSVLKDEVLCELFCKHFPAPVVQPVKILVPPVQYNLLTGTAFEYIVQLHVSESFPKTSVPKLFAKKSIDSMRIKSGNYVQVNGITVPWNSAGIHADDSVRWKPYSQKWADMVAYSEGIVRHAEKDRNDFLRTGIMTRDLIVSALKPCCS